MSAADIGYGSEDGWSSGGFEFIYNNIYVEYVVKNPLYTPGQPFKWVLGVWIFTILSNTLWQEFIWTCYVMYILEESGAFRTSYWVISFT